MKQIFLILAVLFCTSCTKNYYDNTVVISNIKNDTLIALTDTSADKKNLYIGKNYNGGIIAYILTPTDKGYDKSTKHGIIITNKLLGKARWGKNLYIGNTYYTIGTAYNNTSNIIENCDTTNIAATICDTLNLNGYDDWVLPSCYELKAIYTNTYKLPINSMLKCNIWSSSEYDNNKAIYMDKNGSTPIIYEKNYNMYVLPIRYF